MSLKRKIAAFFVLLVMLVLGFYQERVKIGINYYLDVGDHVANFYQSTGEERAKLFRENRYVVTYDPYSRSIYLDWLNDFSRPTIVKLKWVFTIAFTIVNLLLSMAILQLWFARRRYLLWLALAYGAIFALAGAFFAGGKLFGISDITYQIAGKLMGALQSPVPLMVFFPVAYFAEYQKNDT